MPDRVLRAMLARAKSDAMGSSSGSQPGPEIRSKEPCRIFITEDDPPSRSYVVVRKEVQVGKKFYGSHDDNLMRELAKQADKLGADAIIRFHEWRAPSMWSWAAAKAGGMAVRWTEEGKAAVPALKGQCWTPKGQDSGRHKHPATPVWRQPAEVTGTSPVPALSAFPAVRPCDSLPSRNRMTRPPL